MTSPARSRPPSREPSPGRDPRSDEARRDRDHALVRARFEILRRDAEIECLRRRLAALEPPGGRPDEVGRHRLAATLERLAEECAFVERVLEAPARSAEDEARMRTIAHRPWRDLDGTDRSLLSDAEVRRLTRR